MASASDDFNRANETPLGGNWTPYANIGDPMRLVTNAVAINNPAADAHAYWNAATFGDDQFAQADLTVTGTAGSNAGIGLVLRSDGATNATHYRIVADHAASNNVSIARQNTGTFNPLKQVTQAWTDGATWRVEISGYVISVYLNSSLVTTYDDSASGSKIASGRTGIGFSSTVTSASLDNWSGGDLATPTFQELVPDADTDADSWTTAPLWSKVDEASAGGDVITATAS